MCERNEAPQANLVAPLLSRKRLAPMDPQQWAVAAQAFHWADPPRALPEIRRILQPNRYVTVLWNNRDVLRANYCND